MTFERRKLKYAATFNDDVLAESSDPEFQIEYVDIGDVDAIHGITGSTSYLFQDAPSRARRVVQNGDTIISTVRTYLKAIAPILHPPPNLVVSTGFAVVRPNSRSLAPGFSKYALRESSFIGEVVSKSVGVSYPAINSTDLAGIPIPLPPLSTQRVIADYLDAETARIDALIAAKENLLAILAEKRKVLVTQAVTRGLDPSVPMRDSGIPWLGEIPAHWGVRRLKFLLEGIEQGWSPQCDNYPAGPDEWGVMKSGCVNGGVFREDENKRLPDDVEPASHLEIQPGDILISRASGSSKLLGSVARAPTNVRTRLLFSDLLYRLKPATAHIDSDFLVQMLGSDLGRTQVRMAISSTGGLANKLPQTNLREFVATVPPLREQRRIAESVSKATRRIDDMAEANRATIKLLKERREAIIAAAVTGQLETPGATP